MKRSVIFLIFIYLSIPILACSNRTDSLKVFLKQIDEKESVIAEIMRSKYAKDPLNTIDSYLSFMHRLEYDSTLQRMEWVDAFSDSCFVCNCTKYVTNKIIGDTALDFIDRYLTELYVTNKYNEQIIVKCAEYAIMNYHSREALVIPELYYWNHYELNNRLEMGRFYGMIQFVLLNAKNFWGFDKNYENTLKSIVNEPTEDSPYYNQFRKMIDCYSDIELARISKAQEQKLADVLRVGIAQGDKKAELTYSFMLLTGLFVDKNESLGYEILHSLLKIQ